MKTDDDELMGVPSEAKETLMSRDWTSAQSCIVDGGLTSLALSHERDILVLKIDAACKILT